MFVDETSTVKRHPLKGESVKYASLWIDGLSK